MNFDINCRRWKPETQYASTRRPWLKARVTGVLLLLVLCGALIGYSRPAESNARPSLRVLFVGNSYTGTGDLPRVVQGMINSSDAPFKIKADAVIKNSADWEEILKETRASKVISQGRYDMVIIQDHSMAALDKRRSEMLSDARQFNRLITSRGGRTYLFCTWAHKDMPKKSQDEITAAYSEVARQIGGELIPVGPAWEAVRAIAYSPELFSHDGSHPSPEGVYLSACVIYATLTGHSPVDNTYRHTFRSHHPVVIKNYVAHLLQVEAWKTVQKFHPEKSTQSPRS
jgi:hypothetical protein